MSQLESNITKEIMLAASREKATLFRNNTGMGWIGERINYSQPGYVLLRNARPLNAGLCKGGSDLIGWKKITITADMVGKEIAIFTAVEVKSLKGRASADQINFINQVRLNGGISGIARNTDDARNLLESHK